MDYKYHKKYHKRVKSLYVEKCRYFVENLRTDVMHEYFDCVQEYMKNIKYM